MTELVLPSRDAASVVTMLERARDWLAQAVETTGPEEIAAAKAQIVTAETYARELHLSKEIQLDAQEMVRRAEYALGKAIRRGQKEGTVYAQGTNPGPQRDYLRNGQVVHAGGVAQTDTLSIPVTDLANKSELYNSRGNILDLVDGVEPEEFDHALDEAKAEGNLSRANVVRKVKQQTSPVARDQRASLIVKLADEGYSTRQMPAKLGISEQAIRQIVRDYDIDVPADAAMRRTKRANSTAVVEQTVTALEGLVMGVGLIDYDALDLTQASHWTESLTESLRVLSRMNKNLKELSS